jgi:3-phenylpropionate/trans-cinnamate dioxygenase ferredoxin reductase subunit
MAPTRFVNVGGGLAAATAAEELRKRDAGAGIHLFAAESHNPYIRPPLSKEFMLGKDGRDSVFVHPKQWYRDNDIVLGTGERVASLGDHTLTLEGGREVPFDRVLLATGAQPRRLDLPGADAEGIHYLRTLDDSEALMAAIGGGGKQVVVVGSGWIGLELAAAARGYGNAVTVVTPAAVPLAGPLGEELGTMFRELHEQNGVAFRLETQTTGFSADAGRVTGVETSGGHIPADVVIVGIGAAPDSALAEAAGLETGDGILTDEHLQTSAPDVFAAGDVANPYHPVSRQRIRNEHWANAIAGGKVAAASMTGVTGADAVLDDIPYFYTDQFDLGMEYSGYGPLANGAEVVYRGDRPGRELIAFWLNGGRVVAGMNVNVWDVNDDVQALIRSEKKVDPARLADPAIPLAEV